MNTFNQPTTAPLIAHVTHVYDCLGSWQHPHTQTREDTRTAYLGAPGLTILDNLEFMPILQSPSRSSGPRQEPMRAMHRHGNFGE